MSFINYKKKGGSILKSVFNLFWEWWRLENYIYGDYEWKIMGVLLLLLSGKWHISWSNFFGLGGGLFEWEKPIEKTI